MASPPPQAPTPRGSARVARLAGIDVFVHWSWLAVAVFRVQIRYDEYASYGWAVAEYLALFGIVLAHELGHALACRSVGGKADRIVLWPLGGIAYVQPPQRPGAYLWSIAAGSLVNVVLVPVTLGSMIVSDGELGHFFRRLALLNGVLLVFNMLPIYPLDGGQIVRSLLWFVIGRAKSLTVATIVGFLGAGGMAILAIYWHSIWFGVLAFFNAQRAFAGYRAAHALRALEGAPRHADVACPSCDEAPPRGPYWGCACGARFDTFDTAATCVSCGHRFTVTACLYCNEGNSLERWLGRRAPRSAHPAGTSEPTVPEEP